MSSGSVTLDSVKRVKAARANNALLERTEQRFIMLSSRLLAAAHLNRYSGDFRA